MRSKTIMSMIQFICVDISSHVSTFSYFVIGLIHNDNIHFGKSHWIVIGVHNRPSCYVFVKQWHFAKVNCVCACAGDFLCLSIYKCIMVSAYWKNKNGRAIISLLFFPQHKYTWAKNLWRLLLCSCITWNSKSYAEVSECRLFLCKWQITFTLYNVINACVQRTKILRKIRASGLDIKQLFCQLYLDCDKLLIPLQWPLILQAIHRNTCIV